MLTDIKNLLGVSNGVEGGGGPEASPFLECYKGEAHIARNPTDARRTPFVKTGDILFNYGPGTQYPRVSAKTKKERSEKMSW